MYPSALPALWKPGIQRYFRDSLISLKAACAKEGLRGMSFGDEINTNRVSLFGSFEQLERLDGLQEGFRVWFYGHWLVEYARMAKEIVGDVPVFVTSAGINGPADGYLQIHKQALLEGVDGLSRNHYAWVGKTGGRASGHLRGRHAEKVSAGDDRRDARYRAASIRADQSLLGQ